MHGELTHAGLDATTTQPGENRTVPPQIRRVGVKISSIIVQVLRFSNSSPLFARSVLHVTLRQKKKELETREYYSEKLVQDINMKMHKKKEVPSKPDGIRTKQKRRSRRTGQIHER